MAKKIKLKVTEERLNDLPFAVYRKSNNDPDAQAKMIAHFMVNDAGNYVDMPAALAALDVLTMGEIMETVNQLRDLADSAAAPKA